MKPFFIAFLISSLSLTFAKIDQNTGTVNTIACMAWKHNSHCFKPPSPFLITSEHPFVDIDNCNSAGDALVDKDKMFIEFELVY